MCLGFFLWFPELVRSVILSVHRGDGGGGRRPPGRLAGGQDRQEAHPDVLLAAVRLRLHRHHRGAERVDALRRPRAHRPRQRGHVARRAGEKHSFTPAVCDPAPTPPQTVTLII